MNSKNILVAIAAVSVMSIPAAFAQEAPLNGISARVGVFYPTERAARNASRTWFAAGFQYKMRDLMIGSANPNYKAHFAVSVDFYSRNDYRVVPVLANYVGEYGDRWFYSAGAGVAFTRMPATGTGDQERARFAYQFGIGYNLTKGATPAFIEGKFFGNSDSEVNGFGVYAGIRF